MAWETPHICGLHPENAIFVEKNFLLIVAGVAKKLRVLKNCYMLLIKIPKYQKSSIFLNNLIQYNLYLNWRKN